MLPSEDTPVNLYAQNWYKEDFPNENEIVMIKIVKVTDLSADCELLEFGSIKGFISINDCSKKGITTLKSILRLNKIEPFQVLRVDRHKGYVDLSKKYLTLSEIEKCNDKFGKSKFVQSVFHRLSETSGIDLTTLLEEICWPLYSSYSHAQDALEVCVKKGVLLGELDVFKSIVKTNIGPSKLSEQNWIDIQKQLKTTLDHRLKPKEQILECVIQVCCYSEAGIDAIKDALRAGLASQTEEYPLTIVTFPPGFVIRTKTYDEDGSRAVIKTALLNIEKKIKAYPWSSFSITKDIYVV